MLKMHFVIIGLMWKMSIKSKKLKKMVMWAAMT